MREELELADFDVLDDDLEVLELDVPDFESETIKKKNCSLKIIKYR